MRAASILSFPAKIGFRAADARGIAALASALHLARSLGLALLLWWAVAAWMHKPLSLPSPWPVFATWWSLATDGELVRQTLASLRRLALAYVLAAVIGIPLGFAMGRWQSVDRAAGPIVNAVRAISGIAWIPLAVVWFGVSEVLPVFIIAYGALFPFVLNAQAAMMNRDVRMATVARTLGAGPVRIALTIVLPAALPYLLTGARIALGLGWMSIIAAELLGAPSGLGFSIEYSRMLQQTPRMLAWILWVGAAGYLLDTAVRALFAWLAPWSAAGRLRGER
jgi:ABC-type nitrate/sulfonate/bicarbonate transport system permease component